MAIMERDAPLPEAMQGRWLDPEDATMVLVIDGAEITCFGKSVAYDYKEVEESEGALTVTFKIDDESLEDAFQRENITGLVITPDDTLHAYNVKFACEFVRVN